MGLIGLPWGSRLCHGPGPGWSLLILLCSLPHPPAPSPQMPARQLLTSLYWSLQTILVGDSGVGKTSLLVQFDQGKFIPGSFSATVGIGFTVRTRSRVPGLCSLTQPHGSSFIWITMFYDSIILSNAKDKEFGGFILVLLDEGDRFSVLSLSSWGQPRFRLLGEMEDG